MNELAQKVLDLFADKNPTIVSVRDFSHIPLEEWQYLIIKGVKKIRYKVTEVTEKYVIVITEWLEDYVLELHSHDDADEVCFIIKGKLHSIVDNLKRYTFQKLFFKAHTIHKVKGWKGTQIAVEFKFLT
jgi:hypothetical protein